MPKYRLIYFNARGFGEMARMVFAQAGVEYEDVRFEREGWPEYKPKTPFGQAPVLEVDGVQIADSAGIARFLARQFGLAGNGPIEEAQVDMYAAAAYDLIKPCIDFFHAEGERQVELKKKFAEEIAPKFLNRFEKTLTENEDSGFLVGKGVTWADFTLLHFMEWVNTQIPEVVAEYPKIAEHTKRVEALPKIAEWIKKRPVTKM